METESTSFGQALGRPPRHRWVPDWAKSHFFTTRGSSPPDLGIGVATLAKTWRARRSEIHPLRRSWLDLI